MKLRNVTTQAKMGSSFVTAQENDNTLGLKGLFLLLCSRLFLFAFLQALLALIVHSWTGSQKYWMVAASVTNIISISLLVTISRIEGEKYLSIFRFHKDTLKTDVIMFLGICMLSIPVTLIPPIVLSRWLWGDPGYYQEILFQPIPVYLIFSLLLVFPGTIAFAELPTYFGYIMPRLSARVRSKFWVVLLPVIFLSIQHCSLPLIFDLRFLLLRGLMYLPFALLLGVGLYKRPSLMPFLVIEHGLMDALAVTMYLK